MLDGVVDGLANFLGVHVAERSARGGKVLAEGGNGTPVHFTNAGDDAVGRKVFAQQAKEYGTVGCMHPEFLEGALAEEVVQAFAGAHETFLVTLCDFVFAAEIQCLFAALSQLINEFLFDGHNKLGGYSVQNSVSTPKVDLGWRKATCLPWAPGTGVSCRRRTPAAFAVASWPRMSFVA